MSAAQRVPFIAGTLGFGAALIAMITVPAARNVIAKYTGTSAPGWTWRILAIGFALINLKTTLFAWHVRLIPLSYHFYRTGRSLKTDALTMLQIIRH